MYEPKDIYSWDYWDHAMRTLRSAEKPYISKNSDVNDKETDLKIKVEPIEKSIESNMPESKSNASSVMSHMQIKHTGRTMSGSSGTKSKLQNQSIEFWEELLYDKFLDHIGIWICLTCADGKGSPEFKTQYDFGEHIKKLHPIQWEEREIVRI